MYRVWEGGGGVVASAATKLAMLYERGVDVERERERECVRVRESV